MHIFPAADRYSLMKHRISQILVQKPDISKGSTTQMKTERDKWFK